MPVYYQCQRCTACCRWPGEVCLETSEISHLAGFLLLSELDFIQVYTRLRSDRRGLALQEHPDGTCVFLRGLNCLVQAVKPKQCREFPNLWKRPDFESVCQALPLEVCEGEYEQRIYEQRVGIAGQPV